MSRTPLPPRETGPWGPSVLGVTGDAPWQSPGRGWEGPPGKRGPQPPDVRGQPQAGSAPPHLVLHALHLRGCQGVRLGQHRHDVHPLVQGSHELHVQGPEAAGQLCEPPVPSLTPWCCSEPQVGREGGVMLLPMAEGRDEVDAAVDAVVLDVFPVQATLITEILLELLVDVVSHRLPAGGTGGLAAGVTTGAPMGFPQSQPQHPRAQHLFPGLSVPRTGAAQTTAPWGVPASEPLTPTAALPVPRATPAHPRPSPRTTRCC